MASRFPASTSSVLLAASIFAIGASGASAEEVTTPSGLKYEIITKGGDGPHPKMFDRVKVHYDGTLTDGKKFDSSRDRGQPAEFALGQVIEGWNEGLALMTPGARYKFTIPPELGYGKAGSPPVIPADATLLFDVELIEITHVAPPLPDFKRVDGAKASKTTSGLEYEVARAGSGALTVDDVVSFQYTMWSIAGKPLGSSLAGDKPLKQKPAQLRAPFLRDAILAAGVNGAIYLEVPGKDVFGARKPPTVNEGDPVVFYVDILEKVEVKVPDFAWPKDEELTATASGLKYVVVKEGSGNAPNAFSRVEVNYAGWTQDGKSFDSSYGRGETATFGLNEVIKGWTEGVQLMKPGAIYKFVIPAELAYGALGSPPTIPPNATLLFQVELIAVK